MASLDQQIDILQKEADHLKSLIMGEGKGITTPLKRKRQDQRADKLHEITILRDKKEALQEIEALQKINDLFRNTKYIVIVEVNGYRVTLDKDFSFVLKFSCGHTRPMHISEMLSYQKSCPNKHVLLTRWQSILSSQTSLSTSFSCDKCKQAKAKKLNMFRRHSPKDVIGSASMSLRII